MYVQIVRANILSDPMGELRSPKTPRVRVSRKRREASFPSRTSSPEGTTHTRRTLSASIIHKHKRRPTLRVGHPAYTCGVSGKLDSIGSTDKARLPKAKGYSTKGCNPYFDLSFFNDKMSEPDDYIVNVLRSYKNRVADFLANGHSGVNEKHGNTYTFKSHGKEYRLIIGNVHAQNSMWLFNNAIINTLNIEKEFGHTFDYASCSFCMEECIFLRGRRICEICGISSCGIYIQCDSKIVNNMCIYCRDKILT